MKSALFLWFWAALALGAPPDFHYALVHGGGPDWVVSMKDVARSLEVRGVPSSRIHLLRYDYRDPLDDTNAGLVRQFRALPASPARLRVITHSLGDFVGLRALLESDLKNADGYVALGGVANGQDKAPALCAVSPCPEYTKVLRPYGGAYTTAVWKRLADKLGALPHCALYSLDDKRVKSPRHSAVFSHSRVGVLKGLSHLDLIHEPVVLDRVRSVCGWKDF